MAYSDGLDRMRDLLASLGNPEKNLKVIHVAGTNGKGSTSMMIASVLEEAGYSIGLFISPHIESENERIQIWKKEGNEDSNNHRLIDQGELEGLIHTVRQASKGTRLHIFEEYTAAAYLYFADRKPDYVVLECGLGGRLDSTNTLDKPLVSIITKVSIDHTETLGNTIVKIAREKAGIIKPGVPVVSETMDAIVKNILRRTAEERGCDFVDASVLVDDYRKYELGMRGEHQIQNAATAVEAIKAAGIEVSEDSIRAGLAKAFNPGRFEVLGTKPYFILDGGHNPDAVESLTRTYNTFAREKKIRRTLVIFGAMKDKNSLRMIQLLTENLRGASYAVTTFDSDRACDPDTLGELFTRCGRGVLCYDSAYEAFTEAMERNYDCILVTGSIYLVGAMRAYYSERYLKAD